MLKLSYVVPLILLLLIVVAIAQPTYADTYEFNFTPAVGAAPTNGSFTYGVTNEPPFLNNPHFITFNVSLPQSSIGIVALDQMLDGVGLNDPQYLQGIIPAAATGTYSYTEISGQSSLTLDGGFYHPFWPTLEGTAPPIVKFLPSLNGTDGGSGTYTLTDTTAVPDPDTLSLLFAGLVGLGLMAVRKSLRGKPRANTA